MKFFSSCLKQDKLTFTYGKIVNIYSVYGISFSNHRYDDYSTLGNCLVRTVKLTKNVNIDKYKYSGYGIVFDKRGTFHFLEMDLVQCSNFLSRYELFYTS